MDETPLDALETAISEVGRLLVRLEKYRGLTEVHGALLAEALTLGDLARSALRRQPLAPSGVSSLVRQAERLRERAAAALRTVEESSAYREAVRAHEAADFPALHRLLPGLFAGLESLGGVRDAYTTLSWIRRGRPRPPREIAAAVVRIRDEGLVAGGSPEAAGCDPRLPAVHLAADAPDDSPVTIRFRGTDLPPALFRLAESGSLLVHVRTLRAPFEVRLAERLGPETAEEFGAEWPAYRKAIAAAIGDPTVRPST